MMNYNLITRELPKHITLGNGEKIMLYTWTARAIDSITALEDKELSEAQKIRYVISRLTYSSEGQIAQHGAEIFAKLLEYIKGCPTPEYEPSGLPRSDEPMIYWDLDSPAIVGSFRQAYSIGLEELQKMHWWEFKTLLFTLPSDTRMGQLFATRSKVIDSKVKGEERIREEKIKKSAKPKDTRTLEEKEKDAKRQLASIL